MKIKNKYDLRGISFAIQENGLRETEVIFKYANKEICRKKYDKYFHLNSADKGKMFIDFTIFMLNWLESENEDEE